MSHHSAAITDVKVRQFMTSHSTSCWT